MYTMVVETLEKETEKMVNLDKYNRILKEFGVDTTISNSNNSQSNINNVNKSLTDLPLTERLKKIDKEVYEETKNNDVLKKFVDGEPFNDKGEDLKRLGQILPSLIGKYVENSTKDKEGIYKFKKEKLDNARSYFSTTVGINGNKIPIKKAVEVDINSFVKYIGHFIKFEKQIENERKDLLEKQKKGETVLVPLYDMLILSEPLKYRVDGREYIIGKRNGNEANGTLDKRRIVDSNFYVNLIAFLEVYGNKAEPVNKTVSFIKAKIRPEWHIYNLLDKSELTKPAELSYIELLLNGNGYQKRKDPKIPLEKEIKSLCNGGNSFIGYNEALKRIQGKLSSDYDLNEKNFKVFTTHKLSKN